MAHESNLAEAIAVCEEPTVTALVKNKLASGVPAADILAECNKGMIELGNRFNREECFLPDLMFGGMIMKGVMAALGPRLEVLQKAKTKATAVIGTVQYDVHDIGKDIVVMMLRGAGFEVIDLGVDVPPMKFVEAVREHNPSVLGMSLLLTTCFKSVQATVQSIRQAGLRERVSITVGGAAASDLLARSACCDYYSKTAVDGLKYACQVAKIA